MRCTLKSHVEVKMASCLVAILVARFVVVATYI